MQIELMAGLVKQFTNQNNNVGGRVNGSSYRDSHLLAARQIESAFAYLRLIAVGHQIKVGFECAHFDDVVVAFWAIGFAEEDVVSDGAIEKPSLLSRISNC